ncbi:hypothetical protein GCM10027568_25300 [Humibacter soli]
MPGSWFPLVEVGAVREFVGESVLQRARSYARDAVADLAWKSGTLEAEVAGTSSRPYRCWVTLVPSAGPGSSYRPTASGCTCPVGARCKHVAAALLASRERHGHPATKPAGDRAGWRSAVLALTSDTDAAREFTPLALIVEVRERVRRRSQGRWSRTTDTFQSATRASDRLELTARVGAPGKRAWVNAQVGWGSLNYRTYEFGYDPVQLRWFVEFETLARAAPGRYFTGDGTRMTLGEFASPLLWRLLADAPTRGIRIVSGDKNGTVAVAGGAEFELAAGTRDDGAMTLRPRIVVDGAQVDATAVHPIGDHGIAVVTWQTGATPSGTEPGPAVILAATATPLTPELLALARGEVIDVPAEEVAEFTRDAYPALARTVGVRPEDPSTRLPELAPPTLVLTVEFKRKQTIALKWAWEYATGGSARSFPAAERVNDRRRDERAERAIAEELLARVPLADARPPEDGGVGDAHVATAPVPTSPTPAGALADRVLTGIDAAEWAAKVLPEIEALDTLGAEGHAAGGIRVDVVGERVDYTELTETPELTVTTVPTDQRDWFDLGVLVTVAGRTIPFMPLFTALATGRQKLLLVDHSYLSLKQPVFDRLKELLAESEALAEWETGPRISRYQASLWSDFEDLADVSRPAVEWRESVEGLFALTTDVPALVHQAPLPTGLAAELRHYQREGYDWLVFLWEHGLGGVLADDMGLGKTLQTLALIAHTREIATGGASLLHRAFLVVVPSSVVATWVGEAARFTPGLRVASVTATRRKRGTTLADAVEGADIVITTYAVFRLDNADFAALRWSGLVLDEAQFVKNHASQAHRLARDLNAPFKLAVTGTPLENNLHELWAMFSIVAPGLFPSRRMFTEEYVKPIAAAQSPVHGTDAAYGAGRLARLRRRIRPLMLRRTKDLVAPELPPKQEQVLRIDLDPKHRRIYDTWLQRERQKVLGLLADLDRQRFIVYRSITLLRMLALDVALIDPDAGDVPSAKLDALIERLGDLVAEGHRALVFSQFTSYLHRVEERLDGAGIAYAYLDGSTRRRADVIRGFREGDEPVFLISLKAGGFGLTLTEADYVFLLDPWWNPAAEMQAIDRAHRIGQSKQVIVYRMVASDTIEEKVVRLAQQKAELFDAVFDDDGAFSSTLSADDIRALLA